MTGFQQRVSKKAELPVINMTPDGIVSVTPIMTLITWTFRVRRWELDLSNSAKTTQLEVIDYAP